MYGSIGINLRMLRFQKNMTQNEVAGATGINIRKLSNYECNKTKPSLEDLEKLAKFYGVTGEKIKDVTY